MHIGLPILSILHSCGGMERSGVNLAAAMMRRGHDVTIFYTEKKHPNDPPQYPLPEGVRLVALPSDLQSPTLVEITRAKLIESDIDVLIGLMFGTELLCFPVALIGTGIPFVVSERNVPEMTEEEWLPTERRACMAAADRIHVLSRSFISGFPDRLKERIAVIPNFAIQRECSVPDRQRDEGPKTLLGMGRFDEKHKQFSLLIRAFALLAKEFPDWSLTLCGSGKARISKRYNRLVASLGMGERVHMPGKVSDVDAAYRASHLFCIPSRYEAFGLVTTEAQSHGLPTVGFAGCAGTNEIIVHGENGLLAEKMTARSLAQSLAVLMRDAELRQRMGRRGWEMLDRYSESVVYDQWDALLREASKAKGKTALQRMVAGNAADAAEWKTLEALAARPILFKEKSGYEKFKKKARKTVNRLKRYIQSFS